MNFLPSLNTGSSQGQDRVQSENGVFQLINYFLSCSFARVVPKPLLMILPALVLASYESDFRNLLL